jgi:hypothetical protein
MVAVGWYPSIRQSAASRCQVKVNRGYFKGSVGDVLRYGQGLRDTQYYELQIVDKKRTIKAVVPANDCNIYGQSGVPYPPFVPQPCLASLVQHAGVGKIKFSSGVRIAASPDAAPPHSATTEIIGPLSKTTDDALLQEYIRRHRRAFTRLLTTSSSRV